MNPALFLSLLAWTPPASAAWVNLQGTAGRVGVTPVAPLAAEGPGLADISAGDALLTAPRELPGISPVEPVVLVTGYGPYEAFSHNVTQPIVSALDGSVIEVPGPEQAPVSYKVVGEVLPVSFDKARDRVGKLLEGIRPNVLLMLGQSGRSFNAEVEALAKNIMYSPDVPDADGLKPQLQSLILGGPPAYKSNAPVETLVHWLTQAKVPAVLSLEAGTFVCNGAYYSALDLIRSRGLPTAATLVHLPPAREHLTPEQANTPSWPQEYALDVSRHIARFLAWFAQQPR